MRGRGDEVYERLRKGSTGTVVLIDNLLFPHRSPLVLCSQRFKKEVVNGEEGKDAVRNLSATRHCFPPCCSVLHGASVRTSA